MGDDPNTSVVDPWLRCHDVENLYIIDGSVFVTSSSVNPAATIAALARRTADHLINSRRKLRVASA
jgi:choline dehydrogenase-like flavoprotein